MAKKQGNQPSSSKEVRNPETQAQMDHANELEKLKQKIQKPEALAGYDFEKLPESYKPRAEHIRSLIYTEIIPGLALEGARKFQLNNLKDLDRLLQDFPGFTPSEGAKAVIEELKIVGANPEKNKLYAFIEKNYDDWVDASYEAAEIAFGKDFEKESMSTSAKRFMEQSWKNHPTETKAMLALAAIGATALAAKFIFARRKEEAKEKTESSGAGTALAITGAALGGIFLIGRYFWDDIKKLKLMGEEVFELKKQAENNIDKFRSTANRIQDELNKGNIAAAAAAALEATGNSVETLKPEPEEESVASFTGKIIEKSNTIEGNDKQQRPPTGKTLAIYRKVKLEDLGSILTKIDDRAALQGVLEKKNAGYIAAFMKEVEAYPQSTEEIQSFRRVVNAIQQREILPEGSIKDSMTVYEVVQVLNNNREKIKKAFREEELGALEGVDILDTSIFLVDEAYEYNKHLFSDVAKDMLEDMKWLNELTGGGAAYDVLRKYDLKWNHPNQFAKAYPDQTPGFERADMVDFTRELFTQLEQHGMGIAISAGIIMAFDGAKWTLISSASPIAGFWSEYVESGNYRKAIGVYGVTSIPFIAIGAVKGAFQGKGLTRFAHIAREGSKGLLAPVKAVELTYDVTYHGFRAKRFAGNLKRRAAARARMALPFGKEERQAARVADRILALEERQNLLVEKVNDKARITAKAGWEKKIAEIGKEIERLKKAQLKTILKMDPEKVLSQQAATRLETMYQGKLSEVASKAIAGNYELRQMFLFEGKRNKLVRLLNSLEFNDRMIQLLSEDEELRKLFRNPKLARNKDFAGVLKMAIEAAGEKGKLDAKGIKMVAEASLKKPGYAKGLLIKIREKLPTKKVTDWVKQRRIIKETIAQYQAVAVEAKDMVKSASERARLMPSLGSAKNRLGKLKALKSPTLKQLRELGKLERYVERNSQALKRIMEDPRTKAAWEKYSQMLKGKAELPAGKAVSPSRFLIYRSIFQNVAKYGGVAGAVYMVHSFENAENKVDWVASYTSTAAGIGTGIKAGLAVGSKTPMGLPVKVVAGLAAGIATAVGMGGALEGTYNLVAENVLDNYWINRGRGKGWEQFSSNLEVVLGGGLNNIAQLFDHFDTFNNLDEDELFDEDGNVNPLAYQAFLQANSVDLLNQRRNFYRNSDDWDRELDQLVEKMEAEADELQEETGDKQLDRLEELKSRIQVINEQLRIRIKGSVNPIWEQQQMETYSGQREEMQDDVNRLIDKLPEDLRIPAHHLIHTIEMRIRNQEGFLIDEDNEQEQKLWRRLRSAKGIEVEGREKEMTFAEWFLQFKEHARKRYMFEQIKEKGKLPDIAHAESKPRKLSEKESQLNEAQLKAAKAAGRGRFH